MFCLLSCFSMMNLHPVGPPPFKSVAPAECGDCQNVFSFQNLEFICKYLYCLKSYDVIEWHKQCLDVISYKETTLFAARFLFHSHNCTSFSCVLVLTYYIIACYQDSCILKSHESLIIIWATQDIIHSLGFHFMWEIHVNRCLAPALSRWIVIWEALGFIMWNFRIWLRMFYITRSPYNFQKQSIMVV